jgi:hypothetical protein
MSHRARFETSIKDMTIAKRALTKANIAFREEGPNLVLIDGAFKDTTINTCTGLVLGADTDHNHAATDKKIESLLQIYSVEERLDMHFRVGTTVTNQYTKIKNGQKIVVLCCSKEA